MRFANLGTADVFQGHDSPSARRACPHFLTENARRKLLLLAAAGSLDDLRVLPGNRLELLGGDRAGQYSIRINRQYRICFQWTAAGAEEVEIVDYH